MSEYRALSIKQPWLYAIMELGKRVENRGWPPPEYIIGKRIALHASKSIDKDGARAIALIAGYSMPHDLPLGCFLATAKVAGVITEEEIDSCVVSGNVDRWFFGPYGWLLDDIRKLEKPIPCAGKLGLWNIPVELLHNNQ
jgi:hypothetical protein